MRPRPLALGGRCVPPAAQSRNGRPDGSDRVDNQIRAPRLSAVVAAPRSASELRRNVGMAVIAFGALLLVLGLVWAASCAGGELGPCVPAPFAGPRGAIAAAGLLLLAVGAALVALGHRGLTARPRAPA
jgi:hypothetical protein